MLSNKVKNTIIAVCVGAVLVLSYTWHKSEVKSAVQAARASLELSHRVALDEQRKRLVARSNASERDLREQLNSNSRKKDEQIKKLNSDISNLRDSLLKRPEGRISESDFSRCSSKDGATQGATGLQLSRSDAEFLAWYSKDTRELQIELKSCLVDYETVRKQLDKFKQENSDK